MRLPLLAFALALAASAANAAERTVAMPFAACLEIIAEATGEADAPPVALASTASLRIVRFPAVDGFVTIACNRAEGRMTLASTRVGGEVASR